MSAVHPLRNRADADSAVGCVRWLAVLLWAAMGALAGAVSGADGQTVDERIERVFLAERPGQQERVYRIRLSLRVAASTPLQRVVISRPVFRDWPEQEVRTVLHSRPVAYRVRRSLLDGLVARIHITVPRLTGELLYEEVFDVTRRSIDANYPGMKTWRPAQGRGVAAWRLPSEGIESRDDAIGELREELSAPTQSAWGQIQAFFEYVRARIRYRQQEFKGALAALRAGVGDCEDKAALFVALCRSAGIPARTVWAASHAWAEVALQDEEGQVHWLPCDPTRESRPGVLNSFFPVYQKGDRFRLPELRGRVVRYVTPLCIALGGQPRFEARDELLAVDGHTLDEPLTIQHYAY